MIRWHETGPRGPWPLEVLLCCVMGGWAWAFQDFGPLYRRAPDVYFLMTIAQESIPPFTKFNPDMPNAAPWSVVLMLAIASSLVGMVAAGLRLRVVSAMLRMFAMVIAAFMGFALSLSLIVSYSRSPASFAFMAIAVLASWVLYYLPRLVFR